MGLVVRKTVFGVGGGGGCFDKECFKPVSSAKETSLKIEISPAASLHMIYFVALFVNRIACVTVVFAVPTIASGNKICKENNIIMILSKKQKKRR